MVGQAPDHRQNILKRHPAGVSFPCAYAKEHGVRFTHFGPDAFNNLQCKAHAVFQRSPVTIRSFIGQWRKKLIDEIAVRAVNFHCVKSGLLGSLCGFPILYNKLPDFFFRHDPTVRRAQTRHMRDQLDR